MNEIFKSLRLSVIDLFGMALPGFILLFVYITGFFLPLTFLFTGGIDIGIRYTDVRFELIGMVIIFSYVFGYILRLWSPDKLDEISARKILREFESDPHERSSWPYTGHAKDKYPYFNFREYLRHRGHHELVELVEWGPDDFLREEEYFSPEATTEWKWIVAIRKFITTFPRRLSRAYEVVFWGRTYGEENFSEKKARIVDGKKRSVEIFYNEKIGATVKRSKTRINRMKLEIRTYRPELAQTLDNNEAHIRLMSGTWAAFKCSFWPILLVFLLMIIRIWNTVDHFSRTNVVDGISATILNGPYLIFLCLVNFGIILAITFAISRIELLFHYRRVNELFQIVAAYNIARDEKMKKTLRIRYKS